MKYYKIVFEEIPYVKFAHAYETEHYNFTFEPRQHLCEIAYVEKGDIFWQYKSGRQGVSPAPSINCSPFLCARSGTSANTSHTHKHYTFIISSRMSIHEITPEEISEYGSSFFQRDTSGAFAAILPETVTDKKCVETVSKRIRTIISQHAATKPSTDMSCAAAAMEVCTILTDYSFSQALLSDSNIAYSEMLYCEKAISYMHSHLSESLRVARVAEAVEISVGYLSRIFKKNTGKSIIEYMNHLKISHAIMLFETKNLSVAEAAGQVGIVDEKYFYRLFKRQTGMTVSAYKGIKHQIRISRT